jgi:hypothetical protein
MSFWQDPTYTAFWLGIARGDLATWLQLTPYAYATLEGIHLIGVAFFFGAIVLLDMRFMGFMPRLAAGPAARFLLRISIPAFALLAFTGALLFVPSADRYAVSPTFFAKIAAIAAGGLNALAFHVAAWRRTATSDEPTHTPSMARAAAVVSVLIWVGVIALGRAMGYERREPPPSNLEPLPWLQGVERSDRD